MKKFINIFIQNFDINVFTYDDFTLFDICVLIIAIRTFVVTYLPHNLFNSLFFLKNLNDSLNLTTSNFEITDINFYQHNDLVDKNYKTHEIIINWMLYLFLTILSHLIFIICNFFNNDILTFCFDIIQYSICYKLFQNKHIVIMIINNFLQFVVNFKNKIILKYF